MTGIEPARGMGRIRLWPLLWRRSWLLVLTTLAVAAAAYGVSSIQKDSYTATALVVVPTDSSGNVPGSANDSRQLAATYAAMIPQDTRILRSVARKMPAPVADARRAITVTNTSGTALLELGFEDASPLRAIDGARALARAVGQGASPNVPPATTSLVRLPSKPRGDTAGADLTALIVGILLGLFLGGVLMIFLERADARADGSDEVEQVLRLPVTPLGSRSVGSQVALIERWARCAAGESARVAFVPATRRAAGPSLAAAEALAAAARRRGHDVVVERAVGTRVPHLEPAYANGGGPDVQDEFGAQTVSIAPAAAPGREPSGESVGLSSDVVVLVSRKGDRLRKIESRLRALQGLGIELERALLVPRRLRQKPAHDGPRP
jgi:capsular polysaccharide biosynthesis protein